MRVSDKVMYNTTTQNMQMSLEKILKLQENISSGKRINHPSDDPIGAMKIIDYNTSISKVEQYQRNIGNATAFLGVTESAISSTQDVLLRAKELSLSALNETNSAADRAIIAEEVNELYQQVLQTANTKFNGRYIFGGYNTGTPPYDSVGLYQGTASPDGYIEIEVDSGSRVAINIPGYRVFGSPTDGVDILAALSSLETALNNDDSTGINTAMINIDSAMDQLNNELAEVGAKMNRLETSDSNLSKLTLDLITYKSKIEDVDITEVITDLAIQENALEASRATLSRILQQSILDFLR